MSNGHLKLLADRGPCAEYQHITQTGLVQTSSIRNTNDLQRHLSEIATQAQVAAVFTSPE